MISGALPAALCLWASFCCCITVGPCPPNRGVATPTDLPGHMHTPDSLSPHVYLQANQACIVGLPPPASECRPSRRRSLNMSKIFPGRCAATHAARNVPALDVYKIRRWIEPCGLNNRRQTADCMLLQHPWGCLLWYKTFRCP